MGKDCGRARRRVAQQRECESESVRERAQPFRESGWAAVGRRHQGEILLSSAASTHALHARTDEKYFRFRTLGKRQHERTSEERCLGGAHGGRMWLWLWTGCGPWMVESGVAPASTGKEAIKAVR